MKRKKVRKPRRPAKLKDSGGDWLATIATDFESEYVVLHYASFRAPDCRRLARWLDRAADYLAYRSAKDGGGGV